MSKGIYYIEINNKKYIGQSICIEDRWNRHESELKNGIHHSSKLQNAYNIYGADAVTYGILELCDNLDEREKYWINYYDSFNNGYNETPGGQKYQPWYTISKKVYVFDREKRLIKTFNTARECSRELGIDQGLLNKVLLGKKHNCCTKNGDWWLYSYQPIYEKKIYPYIRCGNNSKYKVYITKDDKTIILNSKLEASKFLSCSRHTFADVGIEKEIQGYKVICK